MEAPKTIQVGLKLPFFEINSTWEPNDEERRAAWELYVELVTRVAIVALPSGYGLMREALTSLYSLFGTTREILRRYGPVVAEPKRNDQPNFGYLAVAMLNFSLRPTLAGWHPQLQSWESVRPVDRTPYDHEQAWAHAQELRDQLGAVQRSLREFAAVLAAACGVPELTAGIPSS